jgi:enamine deaminase RidA (YjgF/YER057c/UK114 family)
MAKELINPPGTEEIYKNWKFSQAVKVGNTIHVSGQTGFGPDGIPDDIEGQTRLALQSLERVLKEAGASLSDVVATTVYHTDMGEIGKAQSVRDEFFKENYPANTIVGVTALALPQLRIEIQAVAITA